jgi:hypothetical protein
MLWLDSTYPTDKAGVPGAERGDCPTDSGVPADVEKNQASVSDTLSRLLPSLDRITSFAFLRADSNKSS